MELFVAWVLLPAVLLALSAGIGLLVESVAGARVPGSFVVPLGFAGLIVLGTLTTLFDATARLTTPAAVLVAALGALSALPGLRRVRVDVAPALAAVGAFLAFGAPTFMSGRATLAGYITLDDSNTWFAMTDRLLEHGRSLKGLAPSTYEAVLSNYLGVGSPVGTNVPLGIGSQIVREDVAWIFQPYLAFMAGVLALSLYGIAATVLRSRRLRLGTAVLGAQPAILYAYGIWTGMKELAAAGLIALVSGLVPWAAARPDARRLGVLAVPCAALPCALAVFGIAWLVPIALGAIVAVALVRRRDVIRPAGVFLGVGCLLAVEPLVHAAAFVGHVDGGADGLTGSDALGNLARPLRLVQALGIWPAGDFRYDPQQQAVTYLLIAVVGAAALSAFAWAASRRRWAVVAYLGTAVLGGLLVISRGSPWVDGKAMATVSPAFVFCAALGGCLLVENLPVRAATVAVGAGVATAVAGGVVWSNVLAYHQVWLAPRQQLGELETIGKRLAGYAPALMTEFNSPGVRHFLRRLDAEGASELRRRPVLLRSGQYVPPGGFANIDDFRLDQVLVYRTLVLRRSPSESRPPSSYQPAWRGRWYDAWVRPEAGARPILEHLPLGGGLQPGGVPSCSEVGRLAALPGARTLVAPRRATVIPVDLAALPLPAGWTAAGGVVPHRAGRISAGVSVPASGRYTIWLGGSYRGQLDLVVDGARVSTTRGRLMQTGMWNDLGAVDLDAGTHRVELAYRPGGWRPGTGGDQFVMGPLALDPAGDQAVLSVPVAQASVLCGQSLDWIEALG